MEEETLDTGDNNGDDIDNGDDIWLHDSVDTVEVLSACFFRFLRWTNFFFNFIFSRGFIIVYLRPCIIVV